MSFRFSDAVGNQLDGFLQDKKTSNALSKKVENSRGGGAHGSSKVRNRSFERDSQTLRPLKLETAVLPHAEGSCLITLGHTKVLCTASVEERVPPFLKGTKTGWVTAEYGMLPRATHTRSDREAARGKQTGRTQEIQRLIGRALRAVIDFKALGERQIKIDCDVLQADGGTRTAAITGGYVALFYACVWLRTQKLVRKFPLTDQVAAISCGLVAGTPLLDLDYEEDSQADVDANFVLTRSGALVEIQASAEKEPFSAEAFSQLLALVNQNTENLLAVQRDVLHHFPEFKEMAGEARQA